MTNTKTTGEQTRHDFKTKGWSMNGAKTGKGSAAQFGVTGALWLRFTVMKNKTLQVIGFIWIVALPLGVMILILVGDKSPLALAILADIELFLKMVAAFLGGMVMTVYSIGWVYLIMSKLGLIKKTDDWLRWFFK